VGEYLTISYKEAAVRRHMPYGQNWLSTHGWAWQACGWEPPLIVFVCVTHTHTQTRLCDTVVCYTIVTHCKQVSWEYFIHSNEHYIFI